MQVVRFGVKSGSAIPRAVNILIVRLIIGAVNILIVRLILGTIAFFIPSSIIGSTSGIAGFEWNC